MAVSEKEKQEMAKLLRSSSVAKENITPEYQKNLELAKRQEIDVDTKEGNTKCYVFFADKRTKNCPVFINVHGGGFVRPHVLRDEIFSARVADAIKGIVVDVDYKLAPEYPYPVAFNECYDVCRWVFSQAEKWDADIKRISMGGHSAGANLTAAVALKAGQTGDFKLCLQVLDYGAFDMVTDPADKPEALTNMIPLERIRMFDKCYIGDNRETAKEPYCSPAMATDDMLKKLPDTLVISAGLDNFRFEDEAYAIRVAAAGVRVTVKRFCNSKHGFIVHCTEEWEEGQKLVIEEIKRAGL